MVSFRVRRPAWLYALTLAAFAVQTDDFVIVGVLPAIAAGTGHSETAAGQLVTVYSLVYAFTAPVWALLLARVSRRRALLAALVVFTAANFAVLLVDRSFAVLMALRLVAALSAAVVLPAALAVAGTQAPPERRGRYLATVMTGLTGAILLGVPAGTWIGAAVGWRATFAFGGLLGLAALLPAARTLPAGEPHDRDQQGFADLVRPLLRPVVAVLLLVTVLTVGGNLAFQTYLAPFLAGLAGVTPRELTALLVCSGAAGIVGTRYAGSLVDRYDPQRTLVMAGTVFCGALLVCALLWLVRPIPVVAAAVPLAGWSAAAWAMPPGLQTLMLTHGGTAAVAVHSSSVYLGAALGGVLGGAVIAVEPGLLPMAAVALAAVALPLVSLATRRAGRVRSCGSAGRNPF